MIPSDHHQFMRTNPLAIFFSILLIFTVASCNTSYQAGTVQYQSYRINPAQQKDSSLLRFLGPYSTKVNSTMNEVVGVAAISLDKVQPEGTLGNLMVDAFLAMATEKYNTKVDGALVNYGGIRLTQIPKGDITIGKVFELMPFDNLLLLQKMKGSELQQLLNLAAAKGGWPLAGITMQILDKKAVNVKVGGQPLDPAAVYTIANSDFLANGGDNADMLRPIPQISNGYLMRDAIIDYIKKLRSSGKEISATIENRVTHAQ